MAPAGDSKVQTVNLSEQSKQWFEQMVEKKIESLLVPVIGQLDKLEKEVGERKEEIGALDAKMVVMGKKLLQVERETMSRNVIIMGVAKETELGRQVVKLVVDKLGVEWFTGDHIDGCWALTKDANGPIKVVCSSRHIANALMANKSKLAGTTMRMKTELPWVMGDLLRRHKKLVDDKWKVDKRNKVNWRNVSEMFIGNEFVADACVPLFRDSWDTETGSQNGDNGGQAGVARIQADTAYPIRTRSGGHIGRGGATSTGRGGHDGGGRGG